MTEAVQGPTPIERRVRRLGALTVVLWVLTGAIALFALVTAAMEARTASDVGDSVRIIVSRIGLLVIVLACTVQVTMLRTAAVREQADDGGAVRRPAARPRTATPDTAHPGAEHRGAEHRSAAHPAAADPHAADPRAADPHAANPHAADERPSTRSAETQVDPKR